ncbi:MAG: TIR domain-containing protein [Nitrospirae bacterium]|nr:TIR domain-containing protein [Nitrospirota bacterium]
MPQLYPYRIFISHAWDYNEEYYRLERMLLEHPNFDVRNYSVPKHDPLDTSAQLKKKLLDQMNPVQVVLVLGGMYAAHSAWIQFEINEAKRLQKPIIGVRPWAQVRIPQAVQEAANVMHGWNAGPIVASIRELA